MMLALVGCGAGLEFAESQAEAACAWHARCETLELAGFADEAECLERLEDAVAKRQEAGELQCDSYDASAADACLAVYAETACDVVPDFTICEDVCD